MALTRTKATSLCERIRRVREETHACRRILRDTIKPSTNDGRHYKEETDRLLKLSASALDEAATWLDEVAEPTLLNRRTR